MIGIIKCILCVYLCTGVSMLKYYILIFGPSAGGTHSQECSSRLSASACEAMLLVLWSAPCEDTSNGVEVQNKLLKYNFLPQGKQKINLSNIVTINSFQAASTSIYFRTTNSPHSIAHKKHLSKSHRYVFAFGNTASVAHNSASE